MDTRIPVTVVGGYLGAGKTTLINHLLRSADGTRLAILVNDFGALAIDAELIEATADNVVSLAGGCICCSFGSDLMGALLQLSRRVPPPDRVVIETSGVALPGVVARSAALIPAYALDGVVVVADAETVRLQAADRFMGDTITRQLDAADIVVLNKTDLVAANDREHLQTWMTRLMPRGRWIETVRAQVPVELLFGIDHATSPVDGHADTDSPEGGRGATAVAAIYESERYEPTARSDVGMLARDLAQPACGLIRAKGVIRDLDGSLTTLHVVGERYEVTPFAGAGAASGIVCIGRRGRLDRLAIQRAITRASSGLPELG